MALNTIDAKMLAKMFLAGAKNLEVKKEWINELNVFPVPDGDTGTNMSMTINNCLIELNRLKDVGVDEVSKTAAAAFLRGARGNSGVILSQFFDGVAQGFMGLDSASVKDVCSAFKSGVEHAYGSVLHPTEGTILTVAKEATEFACNFGANDIESFFEAFLNEA